VTSERVLLLAILLLQMLPATLLTPAVRPLFASLHGGDESAMHAFMSVNMLGAALFSPWLGRKLDRAHSRRVALLGLCAVDAVLLALLPLALPTRLVLALRFLEGGAHVGAASLLLAEAKRIADRDRDPSVMGVAGFGIMLAVAFGNVLGAFLVGLAAEAPFVVGAAAAFLVGLLGPRLLSGLPTPVAAHAAPARTVVRALALPIGAAFVSRFTIGCLVVSFALFAHRAHGLSDRAVGGLFACMTVPFALLTYPASKLVPRLGPALSLASSQLGYALLLSALPLVPSALLAPVMIVLGALSAVAFACVLHESARSAPAGATSRAMALFNAGGCVGMLLGPPAAGILIALLKPRLGDVQAYRGAFFLASFAMLVWLGAVARPLAARIREEQRALSPRTSPGPR
jgi:MFS transporter, DHA1 family, tetracycline resistance protein